MKGGLVGKIVSLLLGFILGFLGAFAGVAGVGYWVGHWVGSQPINQTVTTMETYFGMDVSGFLFGTESEAGLLNPKYADKYVKDILGDVYAAAKGISNGGTLTDFNLISPKVEGLVEKLVEGTAKYGIPLDVQTLMTTPLKAGEEGEVALTDYLLNSLKSTALGDLLTSLDMAPSGLLAYLCYGELNEDYTKDQDGVHMIGDAKKTTVADLLGGDLLSIFEKVPLGAVAEPTIGNVAILTIAYGRQGVTYDLKNDDPTDKNAKAEVDMLPMFYLIQDGNVLDYSGAEVEGTLVAPSDVDGYLKFQLPTAEGETPTYQYLQAETSSYSRSTDAETKYYVYEKQEDGSMKAKDFPKTSLFSLVGNDVMGLIDKIALRDLMDNVSDEGIMSGLLGTEDAPTTIGELRNNAENLINSIPLSSVVKANSSIVNYLLYGTEGIHYTGDDHTMLPKFIGVHNGKVYNEYGEELPTGHSVNTSAKTYTVTDGDETYTYTYVESSTDKLILRNMPANEDVNGDGTIDEKDTKNIEIARCYLKDENGEAVMFKETTLGDFSSEDNKLNTVTDHLTVVDIFGEEEVAKNSILNALKDSSIGSIGDEVKTIPISALFGDNISDNKILDNLKDSTLDSLPSDINGLTISQILDIGDNKILNSLKDCTLTELPTEIDKLKLNQIINIGDDSPAILKALEGETLNSISGKINDLKVSDVFDDFSGNKILTTLADEKITDLPSKINGLTLNQMMDIDNKSPLILQKLGGSTLANISNTINNLTVSDVFEDANSNNILKHLGSCKITELPSEINKLSIGQILDVNEKSNSILKALQNETLDTMGSAVNDLTVEQVLHDQIYNYNPATGCYYKDIAKTDFVIRYDSATNKYYNKASGGDEITDEATIKSLKAESISGTWKYLLKEPDGEIHTEYKLVSNEDGEGMNSLIENMKANINDATLNDLKNDNFIAFDDGMLNNDIITEIKDIPITNREEKPISELFPGKTKLGQLNVEEMLIYVNILLTAINKL